MHSERRRTCRSLPDISSQRYGAALFSVRRPLAVPAIAARRRPGKLRAHLRRAQRHRWHRPRFVAPSRRRRGLRHLRLGNGLGGAARKATANAGEVIPPT